MSKHIKLRKGLNIRLEGKADKILIPEKRPDRFALKPIDFPGLVPKMCTRPGDKVKAGTPVFFDKGRPEVKFTSPVSGTVHEVVRGERRRILEVIIESGGDEYEKFGKIDPASASREKIVERLLLSGMWPSLRQRPYHIVAIPDETPKSIFISGFDTAPLAADFDFVIDHLPEKYYKAGLDTLSRLTSGKVNLCLSNNTSSSLLKNTAGVDIHYFSGPHPAGNVGIQMHHIDPVNKGESVWYINLQDVVNIGKLMLDGVYSPEKIIALAGSEVEKPRYHRTRTGSSISTLVKENIKGDNIRYISGNVLTGSRIEADGFLGFYDSNITVIPEGNKHEFFGWLTPGLNKFSFSRTFLTWVFAGKNYKVDTNYHGGVRAYVVTGQFEKVLPMDIYPLHLIKAILVEDIDLMEKLGIYEVAEEDFALCEFIDTSKTEIQSIIRDGLNLMVTEMV
jgi:Na+-transporting NADH:ubiquinone oxidoreductase subunit A